MNTIGCYVVWITLHGPDDNDWIRYAAVPNQRQAEILAEEARTLGFHVPCIQTNMPVNLSDLKHEDDGCLNLFATEQFLESLKSVTDWLCDDLVHPSEFPPPNIEFNWDADWLDDNDEYDL